MIDHHAYLPEETIVYCRLLLQKGDFPSSLAYEDTTSNGQKFHFIMYCFLRVHLQRYVAKGNINPQLSLLSKPREYKTRSCREVSQIEIEFPGEDEDDVTDSSVDYNDDNSD